MTKATKEVKKHHHIDCYAEPDPSYEFELIHVKGQTSTNNVLIDKEMEYSQDNSYSLKRTCEMYQWVEHRKEEKEGNRKRITYSYTREWCENKVPSSGFIEAGHNNPDATWPMESHTHWQDNVDFGQYELERASIERIGKANTTEEWTNSEYNQLQTVLNKWNQNTLQMKGFAPFFA